jgi:hypothetical protein
VFDRDRDGFLNEDE